MRLRFEGKMSQGISGFCLRQLRALHLGRPHQANVEVHLGNALVKNTFDALLQSSCCSKEGTNLYTEHRAVQKLQYLSDLVSFCAFPLVICVLPKKSCSIKTFLLQ